MKSFGWFFFNIVTIYHGGKLYKKKYSKVRISKMSTLLDRIYTQKNVIAEKMFNTYFLNYYVQKGTCECCT